ncbi:hypothetical protein LEL_02896 [Akanthomyces lecanii RCEF 1005]|uniref:Uncharacterized protein n=1 Tax=Akanthomyces lecanii RCEF 1005 TaxID=1081108 RepID=A0A168ILQ6_CORDF|nr:hypothetical protein LEL_02896 [Akanthomyces lecanii RCEF 1005]
MLEGEPAKGLLAHTPLIPSWTSNPIPYLSLSAGGLLALADLNTVAQRTAITGGSSWLDALVLAPGLHYQQAADALDSPSNSSSSKSLTAALGVDIAAVETRPDGTEVRRYVVRNAAMVHYLQRLWGSAADADEDDGGGVETVTINVGMARKKNSDDAERILRRGMAMIRQRRLRATKQAAQHHAHGTDIFELDWLSHVFYILSPVLTVTAVTLMVLLSDYWGLAFILALMVSRLLNIFTIRKRSRPAPALPSPAQIAARMFGPVPESRPTEYVIALGSRRRVILRGLADDLQALTTRAWLRGKTPLDGYCEAASKLVVYMVAALSGNLTQAGALVLMTLLLLSAGLLGLSNAHIRGLQMHGRVARPERQQAQVVDKERDLDSLDLEQGQRNGIPVEDVRRR